MPSLSHSQLRKQGLDDWQRLSCDAPVRKAGLSSLLELTKDRLPETRKRFECWGNKKKRQCHSIGTKSIHCKNKATKVVVRVNGGLELETVGSL
jgi:hypothetical protein